MTEFALRSAFTKRLLSFSCACSLFLSPCSALAEPEKQSAFKNKELTMSLSTAQESAKSKVSRPMVEPFLIEGRLSQGEKDLRSHLSKRPKDDQARFGLGMLLFIQAVEGLLQDLFRWGAFNHASRELGLPLLQLKLPNNPRAKELSYESLRKSIQNFHDKLESSEEVLKEIDSPSVELPIHFGQIKLDLTGDGKAGEQERLWRLYASISANNGISQEKAEDFEICFDRGDVHWLAGYCHLLMAFCQIYLAYDSKEMFDSTAHLIFPRVKSKYDFLTKGRHVKKLGRTEFDLVDLIAFIHLISWDLREPARMESALHHFESMTKQSKEMWKWIMSEEDDNKEWIPNPRQTGVIPNVKVTEEMVASWLDLMDKINQLLAGKLLIAFWRGEEGRGVNLRRVFLEPQKLDLVLWVQGTAAAPYLEEGPCTKIETWRNLQSAFGRQFPGFAIFFN